MEGLKVTFTLGSEIILANYATLDSVLGHLLFTMTGDVDAAAKLPLKQVAEGGHEFYAASSWMPAGAVWPGQRMLHKQQQARWWALFWHGKEQVNEGGGPGRNYRIALPVMAVEGIVFTAIGDINEVRGIAETSLVTGIGKKCGVGYGKVLSVAVEPYDFQLWNADKTVPARPVPVQDGFVPRRGMTMGRHSIASPYWRTPELLCVMPKAHVI